VDWTRRFGLSGLNLTSGAFHSPENWVAPAGVAKGAERHTRGGVGLEPSCGMAGRRALTPLEGRMLLSVVRELQFGLRGDKYAQNGYSVRVRDGLAFLPILEPVAFRQRCGRARPRLLGPKTSKQPICEKG